ncbi:MAG TPA: TIR domain-containing protein [Kamptonema sp.]|nr:TIR domain-containing protein [Kamptonema sp.]
MGGRSVYWAALVYTDLATRSSSIPKKGGGQQYPLLAIQTTEYNDITIKQLDPMAHRCFISFKTEDSNYKNFIQVHTKVDMIDHSLDEAINSTDLEYIMRRIREDYLSDSTVTIFLIGAVSNENLGEYEQRFIKRELQASLYHGVGNTQNGILGVVLPHMYNSIYGGSGVCATCGQVHNFVYINDSTVIKEFGYNYYIPNNKCYWGEDDRYCILVKWDDFIANPNYYIDQAFNKRANPIANQTKVRP